MIRNATVADAPAIAAIYNEYVRHTIITFEEEPVFETEIASRIAATLSQGYPYLVFEEEAGNEKWIVGYAYASQFRARRAYRFTAETSVYLARTSTVMRRGVGAALYAKLIEECRSRGFHSVIGVVSLPNEASTRLHEKFGFVKCGHLSQSGFKFDKWVDVGMWELIL